MRLLAVDRKLIGRIFTGYIARTWKFLWHNKKAKVLLRSQYGNTKCNEAC